MRVARDAFRSVIGASDEARIHKRGMFMRRCAILATLLFVWFGSVGLSTDGHELYLKAVKFAKARQEHFSFMHYNKLLRGFPSSKYRERALFAVGEYYFKNSNLQEAAKTFQVFLDEYPDSEGRLYVLACLLNITQKGKADLSVEDLEKQIIDLQQVGLIFRESKEVSYRSPLYQNYKVITHIDKIEFYLEGEFFAKVSF